MKIETGVMIMKNGKAWGETCTDGISTSYGWIDPESAPIHDSRYCKKPTDVTWKESLDFLELSTAELVMVERKTTVRVIPS